MLAPVIRTLVLLAVALVLLFDLAGAAQARNLLVLYSNNRLVPGNVAVDRGLRVGLKSDAGSPVHMYSEFLDLPEFSGATYEAMMTSYLHEKYDAHRPDAIVAVSDEAFDFVMRHRAELFANVPVVYTAVATAHLQLFWPLPDDVVGVPVEYDIAGTVAQALRWHPDAQRLVVVTGAARRDREREARARREIPPVAGKVAVEYLAGVPTAELLRRLAALGTNDVVWTPGYFQDGGGSSTNPRDAAAAMAAASAAPVYGPFDTFIGIGVVGGRMPSFDAMGQQAGETVVKLFAGVVPSSLRLPALMPVVLNVDWRQVRRWGIDEAAIPPEATVHFRQPTFWKAYRGVAIATIVVILLQAALIASLLLERRRRRRAEMAVQSRRTELAHASRLAVAGELTASIAHEINQPLGAVQTSADAADLILQAGGDRREDLLRIVTRIRRDNMRASDVIRRLRALLARHEPELRRFDVNATVGDVASFLGAEARRRRVTLECRTSSAPDWIVGDQTQIQQVLINLVLNAMDAVADLPEARRTVVMSVAVVGQRIAVTVSDRGEGIAPEHIGKLFDSFFSTKQRGMGLGLSIARTIVEAHGGRIRVENGAQGGAVFHVDLPASEEAAIAAASVP
jgi:signal transduction histidine kinase